MQQENLSLTFPLVKLEKIQISISAEILEVVNWGDMELVTLLTQLIPFGETWVQLSMFDANL